MPKNNTVTPRKSMLPYQLLIGALIVLIYLAVVVYNRRSAENESMVTTNSNTTNAVTSDGSQVGAYKDGTYSALGTYVSPGGREEFLVTLTLENGVVKSTSVTPDSVTPVSVQFQKEFANSYKQFVVGKNISDLKLSKVAGSSLTPVGFNNAVEKIKAQAEL